MASGQVMVAADARRSADSDHGFTHSKILVCRDENLHEAIGLRFYGDARHQRDRGAAGWCPRTRAQVEEIAAAEWAEDVYLSPGDAGRFFACAVEAPSTIRHAVVYATSRPLHRDLLDLSEAATLLGYHPQESWPQGIEMILG